MGRALSMHGRDEKCIQFFSRKPEGERSLGRPKYRWKDGIIMYLREIGWEGVDWLHLAQDRDQWRSVVDTVMNLRVPQQTVNFLSS